MAGELRKHDLGDSVGGPLVIDATGLARVFGGEGGEPCEAEQRRAIRVYYVLRGGQLGTPSAPSSTDPEMLSWESDASIAPKDRYNMAQDSFLACLIREESRQRRQPIRR